MVVWGPEAIFLYNDAFAYILGSSHPSAPGLRFQDVWPEIWHGIGPIIENALAGIPAYFQNVPVTIAPNGILLVKSGQLAVVLSLHCSAPRHWQELDIKPVRHRRSGPRPHRAAAR